MHKNRESRSLFRKATPLRLNEGIVPGYGCGTVQDRGGAIKGMHIDAWFSTEKQALNWGRKRNVPVEVCDDPH